MNYFNRRQSITSFSRNFVSPLIELYGGYAATIGISIIAGMDAKDDPQTAHALLFSVAPYFITRFVNELNNAIGEEEPDLFEKYGHLTIRALGAIAATTGVFIPYKNEIFARSAFGFFAGLITEDISCRVGAAVSSGIARLMECSESAESAESNPPALGV